MTKTFATEDEATNWAIAWLNKQGRSVTVPIDDPAPISPEQLRRKYAPRLSSGGLSQRLNHPSCPPFAQTRSLGGRLLTLIPNRLLLDWISAAPSPRRRRTLAESAYPR